MKRENVSEHLLIAANQNKREKDYWLDRLSGEAEKSVFHYDEPGEAGESQYGFELSSEVFAGLMKLSNDSDVRLHMILTAALAALLYRYGGKNDITMGTPIYRQEKETAFINTMLPLRYVIGEGMTFKDLLLQSRRVIREAVEHQNYPLEILAEQLGFSAVPGEFPLFDVVLLLENVQAETYLGNLEPHALFCFNRAAAGVTARFKYNRLFYREQTVQRVTGYFTGLLEKVSADVNLPLTHIDILSESERKLLLEGFNGKTQEYPSDLPFQAMFEDRAAKMPGRVAVIGVGYGVPDIGEEIDESRLHGDVKLSYSQLNRYANCLARKLGDKGVGPGSVVAIVADRCVEMIIAVLGVMKAGGAYLPVDPSYPVERIQFMLRDSNTGCLVTLEHLEPLIDTVRDKGYRGDIIFTDKLVQEPPRPPACADPGCMNSSGDPVYVIYTSGSTGRPKGVMVQHDHFVNVAIAWRQEYRLDEMEVNLLQMASFSFDVFAGDIARTFINGGKMVINSAGVLDPETFYRMINIHRVTLLESTPSYVAPFMDYVYENGLSVPPLELLILGSDSCPVGDFKRILTRFGSQMRVVNSYGVTEAAIDSSYYEEPKERVPASGNVPIGKPLPNMQFYILDKRGELLPTGVPGELYIGGDSVARGYLNRPELTNKKFLEVQEPSPMLGDPINASSEISSFYTSHPIDSSVKRVHAPRARRRLYRTGDLGRWLADGNMEFLGRGDFQVKIRGFRIELGEIESKLLEHPEIKEAVVAQMGDRSQDMYLCGYVVADKVFDPAELREYLGKALPDYMVPWFFVTLEKMPLTPNGKIDRKALPEPDSQEKRPYVPPSTGTEKTLVDIWSQVLKLEPGVIGVDTEFFDLGGNSLMAIVVTSKIHKALEIKLQLTDIFELQTIRAIARRMEGAGQEVFSAIQPAPAQEYYPLSSAQKRLFFLQRMDKESKVYNMPNMVRLDVDLEEERLEQALAELVKRHESLRTSFHLIDGEPVQKVHAKVKTDLEYITQESERTAQQAVSEFVRPFNLEQPPLVRISIIRLEDRSHIFMADLHHIISDGVSQGILVRDFIALYQGKALASMRIQYKDYTLWQLEVETGGQEQYWTQQLGGRLPVLDLPTDYPRPEVRSFTGSGMRFRLGRSEADAVRKAAAESGATLYMVLLAGLNILLSRCSGYEDIIIGTVTAGRSHADLEKVIGMFVNTLALRNFPAGDLTFEAFLTDLKERSLRAYENQDYPFETLIERLSVSRDTSRNPLFDVMFVLDTYDGGPSDPGSGIKPSPFQLDHPISKFDLTIMCIDNGDELIFNFEYCTALFMQETIERLFGQYARILETVSAEKEILLQDISPVSEEERQQLLEMANGAVIEHFPQATIHGLFESQAQKTPDHAALFAEHRSYRTNRTYKTYLSYGELDRLSGESARKLREKGVSRGDIVAVKMEPCVELAIELFGILKAGAAYLPIDPAYPGERIDFMLKDSNAAPGRGAPPIRLGAPGVSGPADPAYIIYTSGTTGKPKGVVVEHGGAANTLSTRKEEYGFGPGWTMLQLFSFAFDGFVTGFFTPLISGSLLVQPGEEELKDIKALVSLTVRHRVNHFISVPPLYRELITRLRAEEAGSLKVVTLAGDTIPQDLPVISRAKNPDLEFCIEYGVTEGSVMSTFHRHNAGQVILIGKPVANTNVHILNRHMRAQPPGVAGELRIGGAGVARGYLNRPELTAERFADNMYRTGDLARWMTGGDIQFLGRIDEQVKIRGFRIETGEIESRLLAHESVRAAAVLAKEDRDRGKYLVAYVVQESKEPLTLREYLKGVLPHYMVPAYFTALESLPLTPNGKIDRKALLSLQDIRPQVKAAFIAPVTHLEKQVADIWGEVLKTVKIGVHDNFFDLGGNSFDIMKINARLEAALGREVAVVKMFKYPTIAGLAHFLTHGEAGGIAAEVVIKMTENKDKGKNRLRERTRRSGRGKSK
jgi:amino acid adenylation domain-containing protein